MIVRRLSPWRSEGIRHGVGAIVEMDDDLASIHIAHGSAEALEAAEPAAPPAALAPTEPAPPVPSVAPQHVAPTPAHAQRKRRH